MKTLVIFSFVMIYFQSALGDWGHPHYSFRCRESTGIEIFGFHENSTVTITEGNTTQECKPTKLAIGLFSIPYNCANTIQNDTKTGYQVGIHVVDPEFEKTSSTITPNITGGHNGHNFLIKCYNIPDNGVNRTVAKVFQGGAHELPVNNKEVSSVDMHFRATKDINAPDISEIYIGDAFYMFLEYTGISKYKVIPKTCTAYAGTVVPVHGQPNVNKVELWDGKKKNGTKCTVHEELLASIDNYDKENKTIAAKMYGFRFKGSEYITIACEVGVFREDSPKSICPFQRRKRDTRLTRRDVLDTAIHRKNIIGKLRIIDHPSEYGNSASKTGGSFERIMFSWGILILSSRFTVLW